MVVIIKLTETVATPLSDKDILGVDFLLSTEKGLGRNMALISDRLLEVTDLLIKKYGCKYIIETGTAHGKGTTLTYAKTGLPVFSCEVNRDFVTRASRFLSNFNNVTIDHSYSTLPEDVPVQFKDKIGYDQLPSQSNWLSEKLNDLDSNNGAVIVSLDSGGPVGQAEAEVLRRYLKDTNKTVCIILDDLDTFKHKKTPLMLREEFGVDVYQVEVRWGFTVIPSS